MRPRRRGGLRRFVAAPARVRAAGSTLPSWVAAPTLPSWVATLTVPRVPALLVPVSLAAASTLSSVAAATLTAQETPGERLPVVEETLANGMRFLVLPRPGAPTVAFVTHFAVGGAHERLGTTGVAHLLEHMLFKGTTTVGTRNLPEERRLFALMDAAHDTLLAARAAGEATDVRRLAARIDLLEDSARAHVESNELDRILTRAGAQGLNATTTQDATIYFVELPANRAQLWFVLEADRMANPVFREFYAERDVVMEERRMRVETSPGGLLDEALHSAAYTLHPYRTPVVGYMSDLEALSRPAVRDYHRRFYGPRNAVVSVVGDVDPDRIVAWARRYFGPLPPGETPPPVLAREPEQRGERRVEVLFDAEPQLRIGWHVPDVRHEDEPALAVLSTLLTGGRTSRLHRRLVLEERLATTTFSSTGPGARHARLFSIDATPRAPHTPAEVEAAIDEELERLARDGPTADELERVHNRVRAGAVRRLGSNLGLALQLAESAVLLRDWRETFRASEELARVGADDVRRVLDRYFTDANRTVATLRRDPSSR